MQWDIDPVIVYLPLPWVDWPIKWYGLFFVTGLMLSYYYLVSCFKKNFSQRGQDLTQVPVIVDHLFWYLMIGLVVGARLGHLWVYEKEFTFLEIFQTWRGGLSSHGGAIGVLIAMIVFSYRHPKLPEAHFLTLLDLLAIPVAISGFFIRLGNFFNQEILGVATQLPWAITFLHPLDGSEVLPRHPAQLYEGFYYLSQVGVFLFFASFFSRQKPGFKGAFMILSSFTFRFFIEFIKENQSPGIERELFFNLGQLLSIPMIILAIGLMYYTREVRT